MKTYTIYEAKTHFSELVRRAAQGETIRVGAHGKPTVEIRAAKLKSKAPKPESYYGIWEGRILYAPDYDKADAEIAEMINRRLDRE